jgi:sulfide:quinone oxidoreductase
VVLVLPTPAMFGVPEFSAVLEKVAVRYGIDVRLSYDRAHLVPPQSAPGWIKAGPLADPAKTGAAIRKQAPVVVKNLQAVMAGREPSATYDGYASCPLTTSPGLSRHRRPEGEARRCMRS